jgi:hypothetical protein
MEDSLISVLENRPEDCEILVVLTQPYDDPYALEDEVRFLQAPKGAGLVEALNCGIAASHAEVLHVLSCGVQAREGWCEAAVERFEDPSVAAVIPLLLDATSRGQVVSAGAMYQRWGRVCQLRKYRTSRPRGDVLPDPDFATAFYRKSALEETGPLSACFGRRLATVALGLALMDAGYRCIVEPASRMLACRARAQRENAVARGWASERLFWRRLRKKNRVKTIAGHALLVAGETATGLIHPSHFLQLVGRLAAVVVEQVGGEAPRQASTPHAGPLEGPHFRHAARRAQPQQSGSV